MRPYEKFELVLTEVEVAWLAGPLEGEGCFQYKHTPFLVLNMTDKDVVEKAARLMMAPSVNRKRMSGYNTKWKDSWVCTIVSRKAEAVMRLILPHMGTRRKTKIASILAEIEQRRATHHQRQWVTRKARYAGNAYFAKTKQTSSEINCGAF